MDYTAEDFRRIADSYEYIPSTRQALFAAATQAEELAELREKLAEAESYKTAWNEWRSLQTGDAQKMLDAAMRCEKAERELAEACARLEKFNEERERQHTRAENAERDLAKLREPISAVEYQVFDTESGERLPRHVVLADLARRLAAQLREFQSDLAKEKADHLETAELCKKELRERDEQIAGLRKDAERLDWLEVSDGRFCNIDKITSAFGTFNGLPTLRAAIDSAMGGKS